MKKKCTQRKKLLAEMERVVSWARLLAVIEPLYPTSGHAGSQSLGLPHMLRMHYLQHRQRCDARRRADGLRGDGCPAHGDAGYRGVHKRKVPHWHVAMQAGQAKAVGPDPQMGSVAQAGRTAEGGHLSQGQASVSRDQEPFPAEARSAARAWPRTRRRVRSSLTGDRQEVAVGSRCLGCVLSALSSLGPIAMRQEAVAQPAQGATDWIHLDVAPRVAQPAWQRALISASLDE